MVEMVATAGFAAIDVAAVCARAAIGRPHFNRCFADLENCFVELHSEAMDELCGRVEVACSNRRAWHDRIWAAGTVAMRYLQEDPDRARFLILGVNGAGPAGQMRRDQIVKRIADVLDGGRSEVRGERPMSRCTAEITAGAVYRTTMTKVEAGSIELGEEFLPELIYLATMPYLGSRAAEDELAVQPLR
jgi:AcrR family transcriptional regulator